MVKVLAHTTHNPSSNATIYIYKCQRWTSALRALGAFVYVKLFYFLINFFYLILSTTNHVSWLCWM